MKLTLNQRGMVYIGLVCLLIVGLDAWRSVSLKSAEISELSTASSNLAKAAAQQAEASLKETDTFLNGVIERVQYGAMDNKADAMRLQAFMVSSVQWMPQIERVELFDGKGKLFLSTRQIKDTLVDIDPVVAYFKAHDDTGQLRIEAPVRDPATRQWFIPAVRRLVAADGSFAGVAMAMLSLDFFGEFYESLNTGPSGAMAMMLENGTWLMRFPYVEDLVGGKLRSSVFQQLNPSGRDGSLRYVSSLDGVERYSSYRRLDRYPVIIFAALSVDNALASWRRGTLWHIAGVMLLVMVISFMGLRLLRQSSELERLNLSLARQAMQDGMTGLANRRQFDLALASEIDRARKQRKPLSLVMLDVDNFKRYNDCYGHTGGDACLRMIGHALRDFGIAHEGSLVARYGGEEFTLLLPDATLDAALDIAESVCQAIRALAIANAAVEGGIVTISAGVHTWMPGDADVDPKALVSLADRNLYAAKSDGRNCVRPLRRKEPDASAEDAGVGGQAELRHRA